MNCWQQLDALKREAKNLESALFAMGWRLIEPRNGLYRAKKHGGRSDVWREVQGKTPAEVLESASNEARRVEAARAAALSGTGPM